jgi:hypothetical protein
MNVRRFEGECFHPYDVHERIFYVCTYEFKAIGIVYEVNDLFEGKLTRLELGVLTWGLHAFPPQRRLRKIIEDGLEIVSMEKLWLSRRET